MASFSACFGARGCVLVCSSAASGAVVKDLTRGDASDASEEGSLQGSHSDPFGKWRGGEPANVDPSRAQFATFLVHGGT